ncbi:hypothetical protein Nepgr_025045 [Nepenthes gracilis]|uniref:Uncharacterized protein n=1 Tax=Nepenthes gracilis TaxID=150966 RepID=A0AAD3XZ66_NEPGR|nr:hypothetical protein Nepgr_025045 [Nepenthes gracilis]
MEDYDDDLCLGKAKVIGVSNFSMRKLGDLLAIAGIPLAINQVKCHPFWQQSKLHEFQSFVFVRAKEGCANVAYLEGMYENKREHKKVQVRWFLMLTIQTFYANTNVVQGTERIRNFGEQQYFLKVHSGVEYRKKIAYEPLCQDIKYYMSSRRLFTFRNVEFTKSWESRVLKVDEELELPSQDNRDGGGNLEEWVPVFGWLLDKLGVKGSRRPTLQRSPPHTNATDVSYEAGVHIDAGWNDEWWKGIIAGVSNGLIDHVRVYIPGETLFLNDSQWIDEFSRRVYLRDHRLAASGEIALNLIGCVCELLNLSGARCKAENPIGESTSPLAKRPGGRRSYIGHGTPDALALKKSLIPDGCFGCPGKTFDESLKAEPLLAFCRDGCSLYAVM